MNYDLISRHAAIDAFRNWWDNPEDERSTRQVIESLPPAQQIVTCGDCKFGIPCGRQIMCELMDYLHFERNDFCSQGVQE